MKFRMGGQAHISCEVFTCLAHLQSSDCSKEMVAEMENFIPNLSFNSHAERLLAEDMFKKAWLISRYLEREYEI